MALKIAGYFIYTGISNVACVEGITLPKLFFTQNQPLKLGKLSYFKPLTLSLKFPNFTQSLQTFSHVPK